MDVFNKDNIRSVIFDYGGTIDSRGNHWSEIIYDGFLNSGLNILKDIFREAYVYAERKLAKERYIMPEHNFLDLMRIKIGLELLYLSEKNLLPEIVSDDITDYAEIEMQNVKSNILLPGILIPFQKNISDYCYNYAKECVTGAKPVLTDLSEKYPLILVSNFYGNIDSVLSDFGIKDFFRNIVESAVVGVRKPDPAIFMLGVKETGFNPEEVVVIGDSYSKDIVPAQTLGCPTVWIKGIGWDESEDAVAHPVVIKDLIELRNILL